jgi:hypothetical protein
MKEFPKILAAIAIALLVSCGSICLAGIHPSLVARMAASASHPSAWQIVQGIQSSSVLPTFIQSISISDDSQAGVFWSPKSQELVFAQVSSWLRTAKPYTGTVPASNDVSDIVHHNIGPSALHITGPDGFETLIYPAWYVCTVGQKVDARSLANYIHYQQDMVVLKEARTNYVYYFQFAPLYHWLKNGEWRTEFDQNPTLVPLYRTNENGQTYGSQAGPSIYGNPQPDLIAAKGTDGTSGYITYEDSMGPQPKTPEEAVEMQKEGKFNIRKIPLYAADGKTVIGSFK